MFHLPVACLALSLMSQSPAAPPPEEQRAAVTEGSEEAPALASAMSPAKPVPAARATPGVRAAYPLGGGSGWVVAGAVGMLVPLVLFALPALFLPWFGPFAPVAFLFAMVVATVTTGAGGAVAWGVAAVFSNLRSGFVVPVLTSAVVGLSAAFVGGVLATMVLVTGFAVAWSIKPDRAFDAPPDNARDAWRDARVPTVFAASAVAFVIWGTSALVASVAGPMMAAIIYQREGTPKTE